MGGTLTAHVAIGVSISADLSGGSRFECLAAARFAQSASLTSGGHLDVAAFFPREFSDGELAATATVSVAISQRYPNEVAGLSGGGALSAIAEQYATANAQFGSTGGLMADAENAFTPYTETNVQQVSAPVPVGTAGCWVTLQGGGGTGGTGGHASSAPCSGGGGGGGGGHVTRYFIDVSLLGSTYSVSGGGTSAAASFNSGSISLVANRGSNGGAGAQANNSLGGAGGTATATGISGVTLISGGKGGGCASGAGGSAGSGSAGGGGGGGGGNGINVNGTIQTSPVNAGGVSTDSGDAASGGNGGVGSHTGTAPGGGGGGGTAEKSNTAGNPGAAGGVAKTIVEWV